MPVTVCILSGKGRGAGENCSFGVTKSCRAHVYCYSSPVRWPMFQVCASYHRNMRQYTAQVSRQSSV